MSALKTNQLAHPTSSIGMALKRRRDQQAARRRRRNSKRAVSRAVWKVNFRLGEGEHGSKQHLERILALLQHIQRKHDGNTTQKGRINIRNSHLHKIKNTPYNTHNITAASFSTGLKPRHNEHSSSFNEKTPQETNHWF
jgi:hypothetical protein